MGAIMKYPAIFSIMKTTSRNNISLHLHEELQPSFDSRQCTGIGQHLKLRLKESDERGQLHFLLSAHFNYASQRETDTLSPLQPTTASHLCILMSVNYTLNKTIKNCRAIDVCVPSLEEQGGGLSGL